MRFLNISEIYHSTTLIIIVLILTRINIEAVYREKRGKREPAYLLSMMYVRLY